MVVYDSDFSWVPSTVKNYIYCLIIRRGPNYGTHKPFFPKKAESLRGGERSKQSVYRLSA
jgi:hypothetical protein